MGKPSRTPPLTNILRSLLSSPIFPDDEDKTRVAYRLNAVMLSCVFLALVYIIIWLVILPEQSPLAILVVPMVMVFCLVLVLIRRGQVGASVIVFLMGGYVMITVIAAAAGGTRAPFFGFYVLIVLSAVDFANWRVAAIFGALIFAAGLGMAYLANIGTIEEPIATPTSALLTQTLIVALTVVAGYYIFTDNQRALEKVRLALTERKQTEIALRASENRYRALFENAPIGIVLSMPDEQVLKFDESGNPVFCAKNSADINDSRVLMVNAAFEELLGYSKDELDRLDPSEAFLNPEDRDRLLKLLVQEGQVKNFEVQRRRKDGTVYFSSVTITPFPVAGEGVLLTMEFDISERKRLETESREAEILRIELAKEIELAALKDRFVAIVSHELRNPLAVIGTASDILARYSDRISQAERDQKFQQIREQIAHLTRLIDGTLTIYRTHGGKTVFNPTPLDLESFCRNIFDQVQLTATDDHQFEFVGHAPDKPVLVDDNLLQHVLTNLLTNAIKYSPDGGRIIFELTHDDTQVAIAVRDEGIGIPEDDLARLFDPFHRASNVGNADGTGLGLSIVKEYVELHGGSIAVESEVGKGSLFRVLLPLK